MRTPATATLLAAALLLTGCATIERANQQATERTLSAAGFQIVPANTPERQQALATLTPYRLQRLIQGNSVSYLYPDTNQGLLYTGGQQEYARYQDLLIKQQIADENLTAAQLNLSAANQWNSTCWGPTLPPPRFPSRY
jgi:capsule polysaccharide export protein KpsE/RkpR